VGGYGPQCGVIAGDSFDILTAEQRARVAADTAAPQSAEARRSARELERMIAATLDILDTDEGAAP